VWLRPGAVISLQTVLGDSGVWNNFTDWVTAVVPLSQRYTTPSLGSQETAAGTFVFSRLARTRAGSWAGRGPTGERYYVPARNTGSSAPALAVSFQLTSQSHVATASGC